MSEKNKNFDDKKIKKSTFCKNKRIYSTKEPYGNKNSLKYFIGYNDNDITRPLCIRLPQMTGYARRVDENATMSFIIKISSFLKNIVKYGKKIEGLMKISVESKPVYGDHDKYIKTKIKIYQAV